MKIYQKGFTTLELVIVVAIMGILTMIALIPFSDFRARQILASDTGLVESLIHEARSKTLASENDNQFGLYFEVDQVTLFTGSSFVVSDPNNEISTLHSLVELLSTGFTGNELIFDRISGQASDTGSVQISLVSDNSINKIIQVSYSGIISVN